jgi:hypothetical protein
MSDDEHLELPRLRDTLDSERARDILASAQHDAPSTRARQAALMAVGLGVATTVAAKTAAAGVGASKGAKVVLSSLALKWIVGSAVVGAISAGTFVAVQHETTREEGGTAESRVSGRPQGERPVAAHAQATAAPSFGIDDVAPPLVSSALAAPSAAPVPGIASPVASMGTTRSASAASAARTSPVSSLATAAVPARGQDRGQGTGQDTGQGTGQAPSAAASTRAAGSIAQELAQVEHARALLRQGHPCDAMRAASAYRKTYPQGTFLPEIQTIETEARKLLAEPSARP